MSSFLDPYFFQQLEHLYLDHNRLTTLSSQSLATLTRLTVLSLSHNLLDSLAQLAVSSSPLLEVSVHVMGRVC
jgi:Leucine-rich repeat (LRR) protein